MAFPVVASLTPTVFSTAATSHLVDMPAVVNAGDQLIIAFSSDGSSTVTPPSGFSQLHTTSNTNLVRLGTYRKVADGTEGGTTVDVVTSASCKAAAHTYRITSWHGTTIPEVGTAATGASVNPDPPTLSPSWGAEDTLWLALAGINALVTTSVYPTNYTDGTTSGTSSGNANTVISARRELNATSDDPSALTVSTNTEWVAQTLAIRPAAGGAAATDPGWVGGGWW